MPRGVILDRFEKSAQAHGLFVWIEQAPQPKNYGVFERTPSQLPELRRLVQFFVVFVKCTLYSAPEIPMVPARRPSVAR